MALQQSKAAYRQVIIPTGILGRDGEEISQKAEQEIYICLYLLAVYDFFERRRTGSNGLRTAHSFLRALTDRGVSLHLAR